MFAQTTKSWLNWPMELETLINVGLFVRETAPVVYLLGTKN